MGSSRTLTVWSSTVTTQPLTRICLLACTASFKRAAVNRGSADVRRSVIRLGESWPTNARRDEKSRSWVMTDSGVGPCEREDLLIGGTGVESL